MQKLSVIVVSTRPGRAAPAVGQWFLGRAQQHGRFAVDLVDLADVGLPLLDEPKHPRLGQYQHEHTRRWSAIVRASDAFVFVTPEYNYGAAPQLINALDFLFHEWHYKPAGFVSYGGISGGMRSVQMAKLVLTSLRIVPLPEAVTIQTYASHLDPSGSFTGTETHEKAAGVMLDELARWSGALAPLRA
jgi:NAD(P)H-dependent FMN reductase